MKEKNPILYVSVKVLFMSSAAFADKKEFPLNKDPRFLLHSLWQIEFLLLSSHLSQPKKSSSIAVTSLSLQALLLPACLSLFS